MGDLNGRQLSDFLKLYTKFSIADRETLESISKILGNENRYISGKAYDFLVTVNSNDPLIVQRMKKYARELN